MDKKESDINEKDFEGLDYSKMFQNITEIDLSKWDKSKAVDLSKLSQTKKKVC
jgi:hypothetical protein